MGECETSSRFIFQVKTCLLLGLVKLGSISNVAIERGPVTISRFDIERSAS